MIKYKLNEFISLTKLTSFGLFFGITALTVTLWNKQSISTIIVLDLTISLSFISFNKVIKNSYIKRKLNLSEPDQRQKLISIWLRNCAIIFPLLFAFPVNTKNIYLNIFLNAFIIYVIIHQLLYTYKLLRKDFIFVKDFYDRGNSFKKDWPVQVGYIDFLNKQREVKVLIFKDLTYRLITEESPSPPTFSDLEKENQNSVQLLVEKISKNPKLKKYPQM